jgi:replication-associated recombination protein RarA
MDSLPESLRDRRYYQPTDRGAEATVAQRLEAARLIRQRRSKP